MDIPPVEEADLVAEAIHRANLARAEAAAAKEMVRDELPRAIEGRVRIDAGVARLERKIDEGLVSIATELARIVALLKLRG
ncbi:hypothetical protein [Amycolatopsis thermoflava]|uniref:Uncharacterized protein n=1 Tax=Amycolatopsis thermoflava TaxID=84480 RepID=A0A3N2GWQ6_9PSEU|nr:hypothetical protein [Amycolatopsis thermoflava]ROS41086.1 hypothetical protein EDD35_3437 [Amycolatopsis thermoflava]